MKNPLFLLPLLLLTGACTEIIDLDLNETSPRLVIEGRVSDQPGPYYVKISRTLNFDEPNNWPAVSHAGVWITDSEGVTDTLQETVPGLYATSHLQGKPGNTYTLVVEVDGETYTASSAMPPPVPVDTAYLTESAFMGGDGLLPTVEFRDPAGVANYYRIAFNRDGDPLPGFFTLSDKVWDGEKVSRPFRFADYDIQPGDQLTVELQSVDPAVYDYFYVLEQTSGQGFNQSPTPSNPTGNFDDDRVLGYFSAYGVSGFKVR